MKTNWRFLITEAANKEGDNFEDLEITLTDEELDYIFNQTRGLDKGKPWVAWGKKLVYFPIVHDGYVFISCVSKNPVNENTFFHGCKNVKYPVVGND